jgi:hypothetical protein
MVRSSHPGLSKAGTHLRLLAIVAGAFVTILGFLAGPLSAVASASPTIGGVYSAVNPYRIDDTRTGSGLPNAGNTLAAGKTITVQVGGTGTPSDSIPISASAAVLEVTVTNTTAPSYLTAYPAGTTQPLESNLNWVAGQTVTNLVTVPISASGAVTFYNYQGSADVVVDGVGYYLATAAATGSGLYNGINPTRVLGTAAAGAPIGNNSSTNVVVAGGTTGVPADASAVVVQLTAAGGTAASYLTAYPTGDTQPTATNLSSAAGQTVSSRAIVGVGDNGQITVYNYQGTNNVDVDLDGYYTGTAGDIGSVYIPVTPTRLVDTRSSLGGTSIAAGATEGFNLSNSEVPDTATGVAANFTVVPGPGPGYITVFPATDTATPTASDVNWPNASGPVANYTQTDPPFSTETDVYNYTSGGPIDLVVDAFGYFANASTISTSPTPPSNSLEITSVPENNNISADGSATTILNTSVEGASNVGVPDDELRAVLTGDCGTLSGGLNEEASVSTPPTLYGDNAYYGYTGAGGLNAATYTQVTGTPGVCTITVTEADGHSSVTTTITQVSVYNTLSAVAATTDIPANTSATDTITATVLGKDGVTPLEGDHVYVTGITADELSSGSCGTVPSADLSASVGNATNSSGQVTIPYQVGTGVGFCTIGFEEDGTDTTFSLTIVQTITDGGANKLTVTPFQPELHADGVNNTHVTTTVQDGGASAISDDPVQDVVTGCDGGWPPPLQTIYGLTAGDGTLKELFTVGLEAPITCTITSTEADEGNQNTTTIIQTPLQYTITLTATPAVINGDGTTSSAIVATVTGWDATTNTMIPIPGDTLHVSVIAPDGGVCGSVNNPTPPQTNTQGQTQLTYTSGKSEAIGAFCDVVATDTLSTPSLAGGYVDIDQLTL